MKRPISVISNGTPVRHTDPYLFNLWGVGAVFESWGGKEHGKVIVLYRVKFPLTTEDVEMGFTADDLVLTLSESQIETLQVVPEQAPLFDNGL